MKKSAWTDDKEHYNKRALELICHSHSHSSHILVVHKFWRGSAVATTATGILAFDYGLDFLPWLWFGFFVWYASLGERYTILVGYWS
jgi:hypothetical protein